MKRILVLSSYVARGTVGLQATLPAFTQSGLDAIAVPTVVLSNHPGHRACAGTAVAPDTLAAMIDALAGNGWLADLDAVFIGYLPSPDHVRFAREATLALQARAMPPLVIVDPVLGDDPQGLYVRQETAAAIRDALIPVADVVTPNRFELEWLSGQPVHDLASAATAARILNRRICAATSIPVSNNRIANCLLSADQTLNEATDVVPNAPHGTGDYFAGCLVAGLLRGLSTHEALRVATLEVARTLHVSAGLDHLRLTGLTAPHTARA